MPDRPTTNERMRRAVAACLLALLVAAAPAQAQDLLPPPVAEAAPVAIRQGGALDLRVRTAAPAGTVVIRISGTDETDEEHGAQRQPRCRSLAAGAGEPEENGRRQDGGGPPLEGRTPERTLAP